MRFHGDHRDSEVCTHLFVRLAANDPAHDLTLAGTQAAVAIPEIAQCELASERATTVIQCTVDGAQDDRIAAGLNKKIHRPCLHRSNCDADVAMTRHEDRGYFRAVNQRLL